MSAQSDKMAAQQFYYRLGEAVTHGPFTLDEMTGWIEAGYFSSETLVRRGGVADGGSFVTLATMVELGGIAVDDATSSSASGGRPIVEAIDSAWTYTVEGKEYGPFSTDKMRTWMAKGYFDGREDEILLRSGADAGVALRPLAELVHVFSDHEGEGADDTAAETNVNARSRSIPGAPPALSAGIERVKRAAGDAASLSAGLVAFAAKVTAELEAADEARRAVDVDVGCLLEERELLMVERDALRNALLSSSHQRVKRHSFTSTSPKLR